MPTITLANTVPKKRQRRVEGRETNTSRDWSSSNSKGVGSKASTFRRRNYQTLVYDGIHANRKPSRRTESGATVSYRLGISANWFWTTRKRVTVFHWFDLRGIYILFLLTFLCDTRIIGASMSNKKQYWSQVFIITTVMSCGLGLACGFAFTPSAAYKPTNQIDNQVSYAQCGKQLRLEGVPGAQLHLKQSGCCHGFLDASSAAILLPLSVVVVFAFRRIIVRRRNWSIQMIGTAVKYYLYPICSRKPTLQAMNLCLRVLNFQLIFRKILHWRIVWKGARNLMNLLKLMLFAEYAELDALVLAWLSFAKLGTILIAKRVPIILILLSQLIVI